MSFNQTQFSTSSSIWMMGQLTWWAEGFIDLVLSKVVFQHHSQSCKKKHCQLNTQTHFQSKYKHTQRRNEVNL